MALILRYVYQQLTNEFEYKDGPDYALPLTGAPMPIVLINLAYVAFVFKIGPWFMRKREPFRLRNAILMYNLTQVIICAVFGLLAFYSVLTINFHDLSCMVKMPQQHPLKWVEAIMCYTYYLIKFLDYMDTIFFVLRKSYKQVTFLHVYHHLLMTTASYLHIKNYGLGGQPIVMGILNSFVHAFMYAYYLISALRPNIKQSLYWKKYITQLQIGQFVVVLGQVLWTMIARPECPYPRVWLFFLALQAMVMTCLFGNFYRKAYLKKTGSSLSVKIKAKMS